ncbi:MAG: uroporphyrinogen-III decarboxylase-like protein [Chloroflexi bacterium]|nr:uroporphyrinogen-III decarboxylase-like protein [Chloroflexota bacterium]
MTTRREVVIDVLEGRRPAYVPWELGFTVEAADKLRDHFGIDDLADVLQNHYVGLGNGIGFFTDIGNHRVRDVFGVVWDRSVDRDIGQVEGCVLPEPTLSAYTFPDPLDARFFSDIPERLARFPDRFRVFQLGFSLWERAWTLRGMENLMVDLIERPDFVDELLDAIVQYNIAQVEEAMTYDIDAVYFGDDWGMQRGLQIGPRLWHRFILPAVTRMFGVVRAAGKYVFLHSCGDVDEIFEDLVSVGLSCFNPFQPEVMDVDALIPRYRGRLAFQGGLSTQRTLPYGSVDDVRRETVHLLDLGRDGSYIFAPAHAVEGDVPLENMLAFIEIVQSQPGYAGR